MLWGLGLNREERRLNLNEMKDKKNCNFKDEIEIEIERVVNVINHRQINDEETS